MSQNKRFQRLREQLTEGDNGDNGDMEYDEKQGKMYASMYKKGYKAGEAAYKKDDQAGDNGDKNKMGAYAEKFAKDQFMKKAKDDGNGNKMFKKAKDECAVKESQQDNLDSVGRMIGSVLEGNDPHEVYDAHLVHEAAKREE